MPIISRRALLASAGLFAPMAGVSAQTRPARRWRPLEFGRTLERIAFGSCLHQRAPQPIWKTVIAAKPELFLLTGDNVYGDVKDASMKELAAAYAKQSEHQDFAEARAAFPFLGIWDDHDYGLNDADGDFPHKAAARRMFADYWELRADQLPPDGVYRSATFGPVGKRVQIILLDLRYNRSAFALKTDDDRRAAKSPGKYKPDPSPEKTMLGARQWNWLSQELRKPADVRIVVSSTQLLAEGHGFDRWGNLPLEQARFFRLLGETRANGVIVISGDRHRAAIYKRTSDVPYPLYDVTSSALNISRAGAEADDAGRLCPMLTEDNFGIIAIDWGKALVRLELKRLSGIEHFAVDVPLSALRA